VLRLGPALAALAALAALVGPAALVHAEPDAAACYAELDQRGVRYQKARRSGIAIGVQIDGALGGVVFAAASEQPLVIDCSLAVSLAEAGRYLAELGVERATYSSAYAKRNVRGTDRPSKHSYGLAIDVHTFTGAGFGALRVDRDFEQGLGDGVDCIGEPLTQGGALLAIAKCQLVRSGLFHLVLTPDYDDAHFNHYHLEALPWRDREAVRATSPAIH
jgi:hypothetical protein